MIYVVRSNTGQFYRRGKLVRNPLNASFGHSPSGMRGVLERARAAMPRLVFEAVPLRDAKVMGGVLVADATAGVKTPDGGTAMNVMEAWAQKRPVEVTEPETLALLKDAVAPHVLPLSWGMRPVRVQWRPDCKWAYLRLAELRGEAVHA